MSPSSRGQQKPFSVAQQAQLRRRRQRDSMSLFRCQSSNLIQILLLFLSCCNVSFLLPNTFVGATSPAGRFSRRALRRRPKPVKVFILAGDDGAEGYASANFLRTLVSDSVNASTRALYQHLFDADGKRFAVRDDVYIAYDHERSSGDFLTGPLTVGGDATHPGFAASLSKFGPEVEMGHVLGNIFEEPIVIVKAAWAHRSLATDFRSPSALDKDGKSQAGGFQYYRLLTSVKRTLNNIDSVLTGEALAKYKGAGHELVGMVWFHGYADLVNEEWRQDYHKNLQHFFRDLTKELSPARGSSANKEFYIVMGELGGQGYALNLTKEEWDFRKMQEAFSTEAEFRDRTKFVKTAPYANPDQPQGEDYMRYGGRPDTMISIGGAFASAMVELMMQYDAGFSDSSSSQTMGDLMSFITVGATKLLIAAGLFLVVTTVGIAVCCGGGLTRAGLKKGWNKTLKSIRWMIPSSSSRPDGYNSTAGDDDDDSDDSDSDYDSDSSEEDSSDYDDAKDGEHELTPVNRGGGGNTASFKDADDGVHDAAREQQKGLSPGKIAPSASPRDRPAARPAAVPSPLSKGRPQDNGERRQGPPAKLGPARKPISIWAPAAPVIIRPPPPQQGRRVAPSPPSRGASAAPIVPQRRERQPPATTTTIINNPKSSIVETPGRPDYN